MKLVLVIFLLGLTIALPQNARDEATHPRSRRGIFAKPRRFIGEILGLMFDQWNETKYTGNEVKRLINGQFIDENAIVETTTAGNVNASTKRPPFKLTRTEFNKILSRNIKGLARLTNIELREALQQAEVSKRDFQLKGRR